MATHIHTPPGSARAVTAKTRPQTNASATLTLPIGNRREIAEAIEALIGILDEHDRRPDLVVTPAGYRALAGVRL